MESTNKNEKFVEFLEEVGETVSKWPEWKKEGWAILDLHDSKTGFNCSSEDYAERTTHNSNGHPELTV